MQGYQATEATHSCRAAIHTRRHERSIGDPGPSGSRRVGNRCAIGRPFCGPSWLLQTRNHSLITISLGVDRHWKAGF